MVGVPGGPGSQQSGSVLLLVLILMAVMARMALSAVDAALLGTSLALNYRHHERVFHSAEALLVAVDSSILADIRTHGLQATLETLPLPWADLSMSSAAGERALTARLRYRVHDTGDEILSAMAADAVTPICGLLYRVEVQASGVQPGTQATLSLQRQACCTDALACDAGDFLSLDRAWRRLE
jgi:Tfp pilus assembly protein PilX